MYLRIDSCVVRSTHYYLNEFIFQAFIQSSANFRD